MIQQESDSNFCSVGNVYQSLARNLVEAGNKRAAEHGLTNLKFQEGDATNLASIPDGEFDVAMTGAIRWKFSSGKKCTRNSKPPSIAAKTSPISSKA